MTDIRAQIRLRPTRIGFLVRPTDKKSLRQIMRINTCLWGGLHNPIIPIYSRTPKEWRDDHYFPMKGKEVTQGYIKFFDPDVYVEAEKGLLEEAGLESFMVDRFDGLAVLLDDFFSTDYRGICEPKFGQSVFDILNDIYDSERRFQLRDEFPAIYPSKEDLFSESCIGCYPDEEKINYLKKRYFDVYRPEDTTPTPDMWLKVYDDQCETPFSITRKYYGEFISSWQDDPIIFIFNPSNCNDVIDLWNLRIEPAPVYPVPIKWLSTLAGPLNKFIDSNHRPLRGNQHGIMHRVTIEIARSISEEEAKETILSYFSELPNGSYSIKPWRTSIWNVSYRNHYVQQPERALVTANEADQNIVFDDQSLSGSFESLSPTFSQQYSGSKKRWANVVKVSFSHENIGVALSLPFNTFDRAWPFISSGGFACGREGWVFLQDYKSSTNFISFYKPEDAFASWFKRKNIETRSSEAGRIARQMISSLGGFWGLYLIDDKDSIQFINKHASSTRKRINNKVVTEEDFSGRTASIDAWQAMIKKRKEMGSHHWVELSHYIERNVIKVGLESECDKCGAKNWHGLDEASYELRCLRCLGNYDFPQGKLRKNNKNWKFRVIGPFAVPDYAQGAYTALLTIWFFTRLNHDTPYSYATALELEGNGLKAEIDFAIWVTEEKGFHVNGEPRLIIGESKSFGEDVIKDADLEKLKISASLVPDSIIVISVLKKQFSKKEKDRLESFVLWAREPINYRPRHWVILLTGTELFNRSFSRTWEDLGKPYSNFSDYQNTRDLESLSNATQAIYLGLNSYNQWLDGQRKDN